MAKVLVFVPNHERDYDAHRISVQQMAQHARSGGVDVRVHVQREGPGGHAWHNLWGKHCIAQQMAPAYDAVMLVEDDVIVPPGALLRLLEHNVPIARGVLVRRTTGFEWGSQQHFSADGKAYVACDPAMHYNRVREIKGGHTACTLIKRHVWVEAELKWTSGRASDWWLSATARERGWRQLLDGVVHTGHILPGGECALWPTATGHERRPLC